MTYQDSGFSEEDQDHQVTTCLMKTPSGSIYIQPTSKTYFQLINVRNRIELKHLHPAHISETVNVDEKLIFLCC